MNVVIIFPHLPLPEEERTTYDRAIRERFLTQKMLAAGHTVGLWFLTHAQEPFEIAASPENPLFFPIDDQCRNKNRKFFVSTKMLHALQARRPDIVVFKGLGYQLPYWLWKQKALPNKLAFIVGGNTWDVLLPYTDYIFAEYPSQLKKQFASFYNHEAASVLNKYVPDADFFTVREKLIDIISVGDISHRKNHSLLLPLADKWHIEIIGDGPQRTELETLAANQGKQLGLPGSLPKQEVSKKISASRLMVHPSKSEGFPRVFAEAFACGVPVVALKNAISGEFPDGTAGVLTDETSIHQVTDALLSDPAALKAYSQEARRIAENSYRGSVVYSIFLQGLKKMHSSSNPNSNLRRVSLGVRIRAVLRYFYWQSDYLYYKYGAKMKRMLKRIVRRNSQ